ncbi:MAG: hypothetical protein WCB86_06460, partial [Candidatus Dormiibacterota bacterium]
DVRRYLMGERSQYPPMPEGYLDEAGLQLLREFADLPTTIDRDPAGIAAFPAQAVEPHIQPSWRHAAETIYSNWLGQVLRRRAEAEDSVQILVRGVPVSAEAGINA